MTSTTTTSPAATAVRAQGRVATIHAHLAQARGSGSVAVFTGQTGDLLVDGDRVRRLPPVIADWAARHDMPTLCYSLAQGLTSLDAPGGPVATVPVGIDPATPATVALDTLLGHRDRPCMLLIDHAEALLPAGVPETGDTARILEQVLACAYDPRWRAGRHCLVLIARTAPLTGHLLSQPGVHTCHIRLPAQDERRAALALFTASTTLRLHLHPHLTLERAARLTGGLPIDHLHRARMHTTAAAPLTTDRIIADKHQAIVQHAGDTLTVQDDHLDMGDVAGIAPVRVLLAEEVLRGCDSVRVLLAGPPGNGKTRVSEAIGASLGVPVVHFGRIKGRYVGESEDNQRRALDTIKALAPVLVVIDESDQGGLGRRSEHAGIDGNDVSASLQATLLEFLGDTGQNLGISVVTLTNRPDLIDAAFLDRFTVLPVLHPSPRETAQIMAIQARRDHLDLDLDSVTGVLADIDQVMSGRHAIRVLARADLYRRRRDGQTVTGDDVRAALHDVNPHLSDDDIFQSDLAILHTTFTPHLPWNAAAALGESPHIHAFTRRILRPDGTPDPALIPRRSSTTHDR